MSEQPLSRQRIGISISESPDMALLGLSQEHLEDAVAEIARHLLALGAQLIFGGDLRPGGFTELLREVLFELAARHRLDAEDERMRVINFLAWPVHISLPSQAVQQMSEELSGLAELVCLTVDGQIIAAEERALLEPRAATDDEWTTGLTSMRKTITKLNDARILLGGKVGGYKGRMPGIAEEALATLQAGKPLFLLGGFGGCAHDIAEQLGLVAPLQPETRRWPGRNDFSGFTAADFNNGLNAEENAILASSVHVDQAVTLVLRGLFGAEGSAGVSESEG